MTRILFLISSILVLLGGAYWTSFATAADETISQKQISGEIVNDLKSQESLNIINEEMRKIRKTLEDLNDRVKEAGY